MNRTEKQKINKTQHKCQSPFFFPSLFFFSFFLFLFSSPFFFSFFLLLFSSPCSANGAKQPVKGHKRNASSTDGPRFPPLDQLKGQIYSLCKDQHGCRYLQKRLEENNEVYVNMIFEEAFEHMTELMSGTDYYLLLGKTWFPD